MAVWDKKTVWDLVFLLAGALGQSVNYPDPVCAVKGSTVTLPCTFTPLRSFIQNGKDVSLQIINVRWCQNHLICQTTTPTVYSSENTKTNSPRYKYLGDLKGNCTLQITDIKQEDNAVLRFRMEANYTAGHFTGPSGVNVTVNDVTQMKINSSSGGIRGDTVTLYCTAACTFHQLEVTWFRDDYVLSESSPALQLGPLTEKDSGNYTCGLKNVGRLSLPYSLYVEEGDKLSLTVGVVFGVLLAVFTLTSVLCIIKRKREADKLQSAEGGEGGRHGQDSVPAAEDVNYSSVQFKPKSQARPADKAEDAVIYSSVAGRG